MFFSGGRRNQSRLIWARVDHRQQFALFDILTLADGDRGSRATDGMAYLDGEISLDGAKSTQPDRDALPHRVYDITGTAGACWANEAMPR